MIFLTGDLGFMALEPLQRAMGDRFINAGVAEQNMMSVAAGLAREGFEVWAYSIAPFCYARPFEQIRNDIAFHKLPVKLVGNGGGYGYGVMGPTHHAIEDYGVLLCLPNMSVFVPVFDEDLGAVVARVGDSNRTTYLRLGRGERPKGYSVPPYAPWRQLTHGRRTRRHRRRSAGRHLHRAASRVSMPTVAPICGPSQSCPSSRIRFLPSCSIR